MTISERLADAPESASATAEPITSRQIDLSREDWRQYRARRRQALDAYLDEAPEDYMCALTSRLATLTNLLVCTNAADVLTGKEMMPVLELVDWLAEEINLTDKLTGGAS